jgi:2-aminoadipate transaminase
MGTRNFSFGLSRRALRTGVQPISFLMAQAVDNPDVISLAAGLVDDSTLPAKEAHAILKDVLADGPAGRAAMQYGSTAGLAPLRQCLLERLAAMDGLSPDDMGASADNIVVSSGSQQLLFILSDVLIDPGDVVITAWPSYFVYTGTLESMGAKVRAVEMDAGGMRTDSLRAVLGQLADEGMLARVKIVYIQSYHQNPTGLTVAADRRPEIMEIVREFSRDHRILVIEDAAYRDLTYEGQAPPSVKKYDPDNEFVAATYTFSKPFAPGVRTGFALLPDDLTEPVLLQKGNHDFGSSSLCQHLILRAMESGAYDRHLELLRRRYAAKRDATLAALDEHLGGMLDGRVSWTRPTGGLYVYVTFPDSVDTRQGSGLFDAAVAEGVLYVPGEFCYGPDPTRTAPRNTVRLCYGKVEIAQIHEGVARLARAAERTCARA